MAEVGRYLSGGVAIAALLVTSATGWSTEPDGSNEPGGLAPAVSDATEAAESAEDPEQVARRAAIRGDAAAHLDSAGQTALAELSDDQLAELMAVEDASKLDEQQVQIRVAVSKVLFESELNYQMGDIALGDDLATLHLAEDFRYLNQTDAEKVLVQAWGNPPGGETLGMILPKDVSPLHEEHGWGVIVTYVEDGYVEDDDAEDIDYDELLEDMQEDTLAANEQRKEAGYGTVELLGWAAPPHYDAETHRLYWAKELKFSDSDVNTLNYAIRVLGRRGVLELNAVGTMQQLSAIKRDMERVLPRAEFKTGSRYSDFDPDLDEVAAYGIGGLIAGKVLAKAGLFAGLLKLLIAGKKLVIFAVIGIGALVARLFRGQSAKQP